MEGDKLFNKKFDPNNVKDGENVFAHFEEFANSFEYSYDSLAREPPNTTNSNELRNAWVQKDKKHIFLGGYSSRNLQAEFEQATLSKKRADTGFDLMMTKFRDRFFVANN